VRAALGLVAVACLAAAPARAEPHRAPGAGRLTGAHVLLLPVRVDVYEAATVQLGVVQAERTENAREWVQAALERLLPPERAVMLKYAAPAAPERRERHAQVLGLHTVVRGAILAHQYNVAYYLPSLQGRFAWSLGPGVAVLREDSPSAGYGLFVEIVEHRLLGGTFVTLGALGSDRLIGVASVVDLTTGDVLWFNQERGGSLATAADTLGMVTRLLGELPF